MVSFVNQLFPRGNKVAPMTYDSGDRTASAFFNWASRRVPNHVTKLSKVDEIESWGEKVNGPIVTDCLDTYPDTIDQRQNHLSPSDERKESSTTMESPRQQLFRKTRVGCPS